MSASFDKQAIIKEYALSEGDTGSPDFIMNKANIALHGGIFKALFFRIPTLPQMR